MERYLFALLAALSACLQAYAQEDSLRATRYVVRATSFGAGYSNVLETYLSPLEYKGTEIRFMHESMRMTHIMDGQVSGQSLFQLNVSATENPSKTADMYAGLANWSYALHYQFRTGDRLKILFGPMLDLNAGVVYNQRNSNNPAQAKAYGGIGASGMVIYKFSILQRPFTLRYQANLPLMGIMFSPEFGESYYEIFSLHNGGKNVLFTSVHNNPSLRQMLTFDFPIGNVTMRMGYVCDIQQAKVNNLKSHAYSHDFLIGFVRNLYLLKGKNRTDAQLKSTPF